MYKSILSCMLTISLALGGTIFCLESGMQGVNPDVENREKLLLQGVSPVQLQAIKRAAGLFERQADTAADPASSFDRIFSEAGLGGMDVSEAAFIVLAMATKDMDDDIRTIMAEMKAMNQAKQKLRDLIRELNNWISAEMAGWSSTASEDIDNSRVGAPPLFGSRRFPLSLSTAHFKIEYWQSPVLEIKEPRGLSLREKVAETHILKNKLDVVDDLLARMSKQVIRSQQRRQRFVRELEGLMQKLPPAG